MRRIFLTACSAVLALSACQESSKPTSTRSNPPAPVARVEAPPAVKATTPDAATASETAPEAIDELALSSDTKNVDHLARARQLQTDGDFPGAIAEARRAIAENPNDEEALVLIGRLGRKSKELKLSAIAYGRLATLSPEDPMPLVQQARVLVSLRNWDDAIIAAAAADLRDPQNPETHQVLGRAYFGKGELQNAIDEFERVLELQPEHGYALNNLGLAYLRTNQNEKAALVLSKAIEVLPQVAYVANNYGVALERLGRLEEAQKAYVQATDLSPKYVKAMVNVQRIKKVASAQTPAAPEVDDSSAPIDSEQ